MVLCVLVLGTQVASRPFRRRAVSGILRTQISVDHWITRYEVRPMEKRGSFFSLGVGACSEYSVIDMDDEIGPVFLMRRTLRTRSTVSFFIGIMASAGLTIALPAATAVYTNYSEFVSGLSSLETETFDALPLGFESEEPINFTTGSFSYSASSAKGCIQWDPSPTSGSRTTSLWNPSCSVSPRAPFQPSGEIFSPPISMVLLPRESSLSPLTMEVWSGFSMLRRTLSWDLFPHPGSCR